MKLIGSDFVVEIERLIDAKAKVAAAKDNAEFKAAGAALVKSRERLAKYFDRLEPLKSERARGPR